MTKTRMYLDVDGCINAFGYADAPESPWGAGSSGVASTGGDVGWSLGTAYKIHWYQAMIEELRNLDIELVWLTTWRNAAPISIGTLINWGQQARVLHPIDGVSRFPSIYWKYEALLQDQKEDPSDFIWIDDELNHLPLLDDNSDTFDRGLLITPKPEDGISQRSVKLMKQFMKDRS